MHADSPIPAMPCTIHEASHDCGSPNHSLHVEGTEDDTHFPRTSEGDSSSSIGLFFLRMPLFFGEATKLLTPTSCIRQTILVCATTTIKAVMPAHEVTLRDMTCRLDCPCAHSKLLHHVALIMEHCKIVC